LTESSAQGHAPPTPELPDVEVYLAALRLRPKRPFVYADSEANYCPTCQTGGRSSPTAPCRGCSRRTGPGLWKSWKPASASPPRVEIAENLFLLFFV
jgi:hypothetical protein